MAHCPRWTPEEKSFLARNISTMQRAVIAQKLRRTPLSVKGQINRSGLADRSTQRTWTVAEDAILRAKYRSQSARAVAVELDRTRNSVIGRANLLGV